MRKLPTRPPAKVFDLVARQSMKPRLEIGIDEARGGFYIETSARYLMTADQAETFATEIMQFVFELRNGGSIG